MQHFCTRFAPAAVRVAPPTSDQTGWEQSSGSSSSSSSSSRPRAEHFVSDASLKSSTFDCSRTRRSFSRPTSLLDFCDEFALQRSAGLFSAAHNKNFVLCEVKNETASDHGSVSFDPNHEDRSKTKSKTSNGDAALQLDRGIFIRESTLQFEDKYQMAKEGQIGEGGFGAVFKCKHKGTGVLRAAKRIPKHVLQSDWAMFENEVKSLIALDHPHIVKLLEYFDDGKDVVLVFELCQGPDLFDRIVDVLKTKNRFNKQEAGRLLRHMLKAVFCCHSLGIVHRDIKPENFMFASVDRNASLKLIDLGLSARSSGESDLEGQRGTVAYMPPEMIAGGKYDRRVDIWGLGIILYIMLAGEPLFSLGAEEEEVKQQILDPRYLSKKLKKKKKNMDPDGYDLLEKMLQRDHTKRIDARVALEHPFIQKSYDPPEGRQNSKGGAGVPTRLPSGQRRLHMDEVMKNMREFAQLPLLKRAALIVLAHLAGTDTDDLAPHRLTFRALDKDGSGTLSMEEFVNAVRSEGGIDFELPHDFEVEVWPRVDLNQSEDINFTEFLAATLDWRSFNEAHYLAVYQVLDADGSGCVDVQDMRVIFPNNTLEELNNMMREVTPDGRLTFEQFLAAMRR
ncbi:unnamed protein product [Amoebophrya sp. A120]|nr:unnamed protein product [Amoebophrya sp. A120]|eukprot:GSA120T00005658001.1